jgi:hypothetical protein
MFTSWEAYQDWYLRPVIEDLAAQEGFTDSRQLFEEWFYHPEGLTGTGWSTKALQEKGDVMMRPYDFSEIDEIFPGFGRHLVIIQYYWAFALWKKNPLTGRFCNEPLSVPKFVRVGYAWLLCRSVGGFLYDSDLERVSLPGARGDIGAEYRSDVLKEFECHHNLNGRFNLLRLMVHQGWIGAVFEFYRTPQIDNQMGALERFGMLTTLLYAYVGRPNIFPKPFDEEGLAKLTLQCFLILCIDDGRSNTEFHTRTFENLIEEAWQFPRFSTVAHHKTFDAMVEKHNDPEWYDWFENRDQPSYWTFARVIKVHEVSLKRDFPDHIRYIDYAIEWYRPNQP